MNTRLALGLASLLLPSSMVLYAAAPQGTGKQPQKARQGAAHRASKMASKTTPTASPTFERDVAPLITRFCIGCHGANNPAAGVQLAGFKDKDSVVKARNVWEKVSQNVGAGHMPPPSVPHPTQAQRDLLVGWIDASLSQADCQLRNPGRVTLRRLNREEYNNTIRDLLGVDIRPADVFPSDDVGYGFDNIGDVLSLSPLLMEKYLAAAEKISRAAIIAPEDATRPVRFEAKTLASTAEGGPHGAVGRALNTNGEVTTDFTCAREGEYVLRATAFGQQAGPDPARMEFRIDNQAVRTVDVAAVENAPGIYEVKLYTTAGKHRLALAFINPFHDENETNPRRKNRRLIVNTLEVIAPPGMPNTLPPSHRRLFTCQPTATTRDECARKILSDVARRAYRRPVTKEEVERMVRYVRMANEEGESFERGIQVAIQAILVSPNFLFRVEASPPARATTSATTGDSRGRAQADRALNGYELASRLSYFLWSSMPDEELFTCAANGSLQSPTVLTAQVKRMLKDPKAKALADNFAGQWLQLRNLTLVAPDPARFPDFNDTLRSAMRTETTLFFQSIVSEDRNLLDFLDAKYTFLNEPLARHYGIAGVKGDQFRRVTLAGDQRGGLLTQASILTVTSNPTRTSPVKRGKWVLEQILGTPPPPPPPNVGELPDDKKAPLAGTLRQRMEQHRSNPSCAACHARMDPLGFGLENYDATGAWRTLDGKYPIDSSGVLPDGKKFNGPAQLKGILKAKKVQFVRCLSEKMLTYALGRGLESYDKCTVDEIVQSVTKNDYRFSALMTAVVLSEPFRKRKGEGDPL